MRYILVSSVRTMGTETPEFHFDEDGRVVIWRKGASHVVTEILSNKYTMGTSFSDYKVLARREKIKKI